MLKLENISKRLGEFRLTDISLDISRGEYFVLLGRSGSGKTQLLELIAGLNDTDTGKIFIDGIDVTNLKIQKRNIGMVFQDFAIFPNLTVAGNISYPLHCRRIPGKEIDERVSSIAGELNISHLLKRYTENLSGGELQRVALARTLITSPKILLLDEPLASLDASLRDDIKRILRTLNRKGLTIVHVTHDYREAVSLASRVGVIHNGRIIQTGTPGEVFGKPVNKFVARYSGIRNFFKVRFESVNGCWKAMCTSELAFILPSGYYPEQGLLIIRSDAINLHDKMPSLNPGNCLKGIVKEIYPSEYGMEIVIDAGENFIVDISPEKYRELNIREQSEVWMTFPPEAGITLQGRN